MPIRNFTADERAAALAKKAESHKAALALPLKRDFLDDENWQDLARTRNLRLPPWTYPPEPATMRTWLRRLAVTKNEYLEATGLQSLEAFVTRNPTWPLRAWVGLLLEYIEERGNAKNILTRDPG